MRYRQILIRSGMSPLENFDPTTIIMNNSIGGNVGNLVYAYGVVRTLMTENTTVVPDYYEIDHSKAEEINQKYDAYVIPLADAFRDTFATSLRRYTQLIKKLRIPVYVIGVGLRAPFEPKLNEGFPFDEDVKGFVSAVLEKSNMIGVRGQITADYLTRLGFKEGTDHTVIGCPSMYTFGRELNIRETNITKDSLVTVNSSKLSPDNVLDFITRSMEEYPNHYFIPQWMKELSLTYLGHPSLEGKNSNYPVKMSDETYMNDKVRYPINVPGWLDLIKQADLSFGARLHGNITATIAGTPSILLPKDARMRELAEYHSLTSYWGKDITEETRLEDLIENADFQSPTTVQSRNFDHFIDFLNKNELEHIYQENINRQDAPLDRKVEEVNHLEPIAPVSGITTEELVGRIETYYPQEQDKIKALNKKIKKQKGTLNRRSVKMTLKAADMFKKGK